MVVPEHPLFKHVTSIYTEYVLLLTPSQPQQLTIILHRCYQTGALHPEAKLLGAYSDGHPFAASLEVAAGGGSSKENVNSSSNSKAKGMVLALNVFPPEGSTKGWVTYRTGSNDVPQLFLNACSLCLHHANSNK